jgi:hypothetical protein
MTISQHTPGPWDVQQTNSDARITNIEFNRAESFSSATLYSGECVPLDEHQANARLIAAAPELLEALEELIGDRYNPMRESDPIFISARDRARYVIAKATGV